MGLVSLLLCDVCFDFFQTDSQVLGFCFPVPLVCMRLWFALVPTQDVLILQYGSLEISSCLNSEFLERERVQLVRYLLVVLLAEGGERWRRCRCALHKSPKKVPQFVFFQAGYYKFSSKGGVNRQEKVDTSGVL